MKGRPGVDARIADLERHEYRIEPASFDLICDFYYLQRDLFPEIREGVRPGGMFAGAIHLTGAFALNSGELRETFAGWKILYYSRAPEARPLRHLRLDHRPPRLTRASSVAISARSRSSAGPSTPRARKSA